MKYKKKVGQIRIDRDLIRPIKLYAARKGLGMVEAVGHIVLNGLKASR